MFNIKKMTTQDVFHIQITDRKGKKYVFEALNGIDNRGKFIKETIGSRIRELTGYEVLIFKNPSKEIIKNAGNHTEFIHFLGAHTYYQTIHSSS